MNAEAIETPASAAQPALRDTAGAEGKNAFLVGLGERVRALRARRGMTRKALAGAADISERHLANLEYGEGNASILVLLQLAGALQCSLAEIIGDITTASPEWLMIRDLIGSSDEETLRRVRLAIGEVLGTSGRPVVGSTRIALIGLRGAGKSTLGAMLAQDLGFPFLELSRQIEQLAGASVQEMVDLYGMNAYRRYERQALQELLQTHAEVVIATPGGVVSDPGTFNLLLGQCTTVWLQADPQDHLRRVRAQGDLRPMAGSSQAMQDLKGILAGCEAFYSKAQIKVDTSAQGLEETYLRLRAVVRQALQQPA